MSVAIIKLVIVEDEREVREGLKYLLELDEQLQVVGTYQEPKACIKQLFLGLKPQIILMDIGLPGMNGIQATAEIKKQFPEIDILMLTIFEEEEKIIDAIKAGATGYVLKNEQPQALIDQIKSLHGGGSPLSPPIARKLLKEFQNKQNSPTHKDYKLTPRERMILKSIAQGLTYKEIAYHYHISPSTVKKHMLHIYDKLNVSSKVEFMKKVMDEQLI